MIDTNKLATLAQEMMAYLEHEYPDANLVEVGIVVELRDDDNTTTTPTTCSSDSRVYQAGLFQWALDNVTWAGEPGDEPPPPGEHS